MKPRSTCRTAARQRGIAALEFAIILPFMLLLLTFPLLFGRVFFCYATAREAARDAALYLSSVPRICLSSPARTSSELAVVNSMVAMELAGLNTGPYAPYVNIFCDDGGCDGFNIPTTVRVKVRIDFFDDMFNSFTSSVTGDNGLLLTADITMRYVGN